VLSLANQTKLGHLGVPPNLLSRLSTPTLPPPGGARPGAPQPAAAPTIIPQSPTTEPARNTKLDALAPAFSVRLFLALREFNTNSGHHIGFYEGLRTNDRQSYLYSIGRTRKGQPVTNASTIYTSWHGYGLAADCVAIVKDSWSWEVSDTFWAAWLSIASRHGLTTGLHWNFKDAPHTQPTYLNSYPRDKDKLGLSFGLAHIWEAYDQYSISDSYLASL
jgi:hypothetical protein